MATKQGAFESVFEHFLLLAARGFKQTQGKGFVNHDISSPVVHDITVCFIFVLILMGDMGENMVDVNGVFLFCEFNCDEKIYMKTHVVSISFIHEVDCCF